MWNHVSTLTLVKPASVSGHYGIAPRQRPASPQQMSGESSRSFRTLGCSRSPITMRLLERS
jgi:hypothetical protein